MTDTIATLERLAHAPSCPYPSMDRQPLCSCGLLRYRDDWRSALAESRPDPDDLTADLRATAKNPDLANLVDLDALQAAEDAL